MFSLKNKNSFSVSIKNLEKSKTKTYVQNLEKYGIEGVRLLSNATPKDTGKTASSWTYRITTSTNTASLVFENTNIQNGVPIAIIIQTGHATKSGAWIQGRDYIEPEMTKLFDKMITDIRKEVI